MRGIFLVERGESIAVVEDRGSIVAIGPSRVGLGRMGYSVIVAVIVL